MKKKKLKKKVEILIKEIQNLRKEKEILINSPDSQSAFYIRNRHAITTMSRDIQMDFFDKIVNSVPKDQMGFFNLLERYPTAPVNISQMGSQC